MSDDDLFPDEPDSENPPDGHSATEPAQSARRRETRRAQEQRERDEFWKGVLASPVGRREVWRLLFTGQAAHPFETQFPVGPSGFPDPNAAWYARGEQDFGLRLYHALLQLNRGGTLLMQDEHDPRFAKPRRGRPVRGE